MKKITCALFDMDGVMIDTEPQYSIFWKQTGEKYKVGISNFETIIKGTTMPNILKKYFAHVSPQKIEELLTDHDRFEETMTFPEISGSIQFVKALKAQGFKVGLVTSSSDTKLKGVNKVKHFEELFDTVVSASRVTNGKPNPECYLLAAKELGVNPEECIVFEDSFAGLEAGTSAGMATVGVATTHAENVLHGKCDRVIPHFENLKPGDIIQ